MMLLRPAALVLGLAAAGGAGATETVSCSGVGGSEAVIEMNLGQGMPADLPNWVRVSADEESFSSLGPDVEEGMTPVNIYQAFDDGRIVAIDLADEPVIAVVISIRILRAAEGEKVVRAGTLQILGKSVHPILCDFGDSE